MSSNHKSPRTPGTAKPAPASEGCWDDDGDRSSLDNGAGGHVSRTATLFVEGDKLADETVTSKSGRKDDSKVVQDGFEGRNRVPRGPGIANSTTGGGCGDAVMHVIPMREEESGCGGRCSADGNSGPVLNAARPNLEKEINPNPGNNVSLLGPSGETTVETSADEGLAPQGLCSGTNIHTDTSGRVNRQVQECWTNETYAETDGHAMEQKQTAGEGALELIGGAGDGGMPAQGAGTQAARSLSQGIIGEAGEGGGGGGDEEYVMREPSFFTSRAGFERREAPRPCGERCFPRPKYRTAKFL